MSKKDEYLNVRIDKATKEKLKKLAEKNNRSISGQMIHLIKRAR